MNAAAVEAGRDPSALGIEGRVTWTGDRAVFAERAAEWDAAGATHLSVNTMGGGLIGADGHLAALAAAAEILQLSRSQAVSGRASAI